MRRTTRLESCLIVALVALVAGLLGGLAYGRASAESPRSAESQNRSDSPMSEIVVSRSQGLVFKSEDGTPLLKISQDEWGTHLHLLSSKGTPVVELNNREDRGGVIVGSNAGGYGYLQAQQESATFTLINKYGKEGVSLTSTTVDGSGKLSINEGAKGYPAVEIGAGINKAKAKGTIKIVGESGTQWEAP
jgi:hypothetical protein